MVSKCQSTLAYISELSKDVKNEHKVMELMGIYHEECDKIKRQLMNKLIRQDIKNNVAPFEIQQLSERVDITKEGSAPGFILVTLSFKPNTTPNDIKQELEKVPKKIYVKKVVKVGHEQRGTTIETMGNGYHLHMIIELNKHKRKSQLIDEFYNTFNKHLEGKNYVNIQIIKNNLQNVENYLDGQKKDKNKEQAVKIDKMFKDKFNVM